MAGLVWHGPEVLKLIEQAARNGLDEGIDLIGDTSQERVPEQTGDLKNSRRTRRRGLTVAVGYTDSKAAAAHENLTVRYRHGKQAKFLESAARDRRGDVLDTVADHIRRAL